MALYGGSVTSRLFPERAGTGSSVLLLLVQLPELYREHGCEQRRGARRRARAEKAILKELDDLRNGPITAEELEDCRRPC